MLDFGKVPLPQSEPYPEKLALTKGKRYKALGTCSSTLEGRMAQDSIRRVTLRTIFVVVFGLLLAGNTLGVGARKAPTLRISAWYWLNSVEKQQWEKDFKSAAETGFTDMVLCWGLDSAAVSFQKENTRLALSLCQKYGMRAYLLIWHPSHNSLPRRAEFQQVDNYGNLLFTFDLFNRKWRSTQWKEYLQTVAGAYKDHPGLAGYLFDDTFGPGPIGTFDGDKTKVHGDFVSYSPYDYLQFREWLRSKYKTLPQLEKSWGSEIGSWEKVEPPKEITEKNQPAWNDWCEARSQWYREWGEDTMKFIREVDPSPDHEVYLEDGQYVLGLETVRSKNSYRPVTVKDTLGLQFGVAASAFDAVCGYTAFRWEIPDALAKAVNRTRETLEITRSKAGKRKQIIYTFWVGDLDTDKPLPLKYPDAQQIIAVIQAALDLGIRHLDCYAYRVGDWRADNAEWLARRPGPNVDYVRTKPMPGRYLCDRPDVLRNLAPELHRLRAKYQ